MYYRESFEYSPIKIFMNSNADDQITNRGDITFNLRRNINLPHGTIGYVSLSELTMPNTNYNINSTNNTLILIDSSGTSQTLTITPGNYTVTQLNASFTSTIASATTAASYKNITVTYNPITNMFTFAHSASYFLNIQPTSTMNSVLGFESGAIYTPIVTCSITADNVLIL